MGIPGKLWDHDQDDFGIWICLIATRVVSILTRQPKFSLYNQNLRLALARETIITEGRRAISYGIQHSTIEDPQGRPFCHLWIEKSSKQGHRQKMQEENEQVGKLEQG